MMGKEFPQTLFYRSGYWHQVVRDFWIQTPFRPEIDIDARWVYMSTEGLMQIKAGFGCDGTSFYPRWVKKLLHKIFKKLLKGSVCHDALYYLYKLGLLPLETRLEADAFAEKVWRDSGVWKWLASVNKLGLKIGGEASSLPENRRPILMAN
jgi:hypothetical protein